MQYEISNWAKDDHRRLTTDDSSSIVQRPPSFSCKHNLQYWRSLPYLAFGAGAHGYANGYRYSNVLRIKTYIERVTNYRVASPRDQLPNSPASHLPFPLSPATVNQHKQTPKDDMSEFMITGLRLTQQGVSFQEYHTRFGQSLQDVFGKEINELLKLGLLERHESPSPSGRLRSAPQGGVRGEGEILRLTQRGRLLGNQVFMQFV